MNTLEQNPPAFPVEIGFGLEPGECHQTGEHVAQFPGMTLRDWFAGQALIMLPNMGCGADLDTFDTAAAAYQIADAMLAARVKS